MINLPVENIKYCNDALALRNKIEDDFLLFGEYLYNIREHRLYEPQWSSFVEFCFELRMTQSSINRLIQLHKVFVLDYGLSKKSITHAGVSNLFDVMAVIKNKEDAKEWLAKAEILTRGDLRRELMEHKTGVDIAKCRHKDYYLLKICRGCGDRMQEYEKEEIKIKK